MLLCSLPPSPSHPGGIEGIFYEEINHAGDGGLYAELVRNRGFEDANLPPACVREGNFIVPPRTPHFDTGKPSDWRLRWDETDPHPAWSLNAPSGSAATMALVVDRPLNDATPHSLQVDVTTTALGRAPQLVNAALGPARGAGRALSPQLLLAQRRAGILEHRRENSFETPRKIAPVASTVNGLGPSFRRTLPPYSLSILRVGTK